MNLNGLGATLAVTKVCMRLHNCIMTAPKSSHRAFRSAELRLPSKDRWNEPGVVSLGRFLVPAHKLRA